MRKYYSGKFRPKNISKYEGDYTNICYRSLWERQTLKFLDENPSVIKYSSEEVVIPYRCPTDNRIHRYFVDLKVKFTNGNTHLIEIKPKSQTIQPKKKSRTTKAYINEVMTWAKNESKWKAANEYCLDRGWIFSIWTEEHLQALGIPILLKEVKRKKASL